MSQSNQLQKFACGFILLLGINALLVRIAFTSMYVPYYAVLPEQLQSVARSVVEFLRMPFLHIGMTQIIYVIPTVILLNRRRQYNLMKGVIAAAVLTALLYIAFIGWIILAWSE